MGLRVPNYAPITLFHRHQGYDNQLPYTIIQQCEARIQLRCLLTHHFHEGYANIQHIEFCGLAYSNYFFYEEISVTVSV